MTKFNHILKELFRNIFRNPGSFLSAILSMSLLLILFDLFWISIDTSDKFYENLLSDVNMETFIDESATDSTVAVLREYLATHPGVKTIDYISKEQAREDLTSMVGIDLLVGYDSTNPLPRSFLISFKNSFLNSADLAAFKTDLSERKEVTDVFYSETWLEKAESTKSIIWKIGTVLGMLIILGILFNSANSMRLTARTRASGLDQMRLLGAGKMFLAMPYLLEGLIIGAFSAALGWVLIFYWKDKIDITLIEIIYPSLDYILIFCAVSALLGLISGYMGIRKPMKL